jgi:autotransporter-associated beta strand protein
MRAYLLATTAAAALLAATSAHAQDATWLLNPGSRTFNTATNWNPAVVPTNTAIFGASNTTLISFQPFTTTSIGTLQFNSDAPAYFFATSDGLFTSISVTGAGIVDNSANAPTFIVGNQANLSFRNASTAGDATIITNAGGITIFADSATGGNARLIANAGGVFDISSLSTGGMTAGSIEGGGTFQLGSKQLTVGRNNLSTTVSGVITDTGGGSLVKTGTGILALSGTNTYTGPTTVDAGVLIVNGSIASSSLTTVNSGAVLLGSGTVGSTVINAGGFLVPGNSPGTMTVAGDLTIQRNAFYVVQVNPLMASRINVSGSASLDGTVAAVFFPGIYLSRSYTILTADNRRTGRFEDLATFGLPRNFRARLDYFNNTVDLNLRAQLIGDGVFPFQPIAPLPPTAGLPPIAGLPSTPEDPPAPPPPPFSSNQLSVGRAIDNFFNNGGTLPPTFVSLYGLSGSNLITALDQLSGEPATGAQKVAFQLTDQFLNVMLDPFVDGRSRIGGADHPALGFAPERETMPPDIAQAYASVFKAPPAPAPVYEPRWTAWGGAYGGSNRTTGDLAVSGSHDLSARAVGFAAGLDYRLTPDTVAAFAFAGGGTDWSLAQGLGAGKSDAFQAGLYGATRWGPAYVAAAFAFTNHWMSTDRFAVATTSPPISTRRAMAGGSRAAIASPPSTAASRPMPRSRRRASTRRATPRPTPSPTALR